MDKSEWKAGCQSREQNVVLGGQFSLEALKGIDNEHTTFPVPNVVEVEKEPAGQDE